MAGRGGGVVSYRNDPIGGRKSKNETCEGWYLSGVRHSGPGKTRMDAWWHRIFHGQA